MDNKISLRIVIWEIIAPIIIYYIVFLSSMYFVFAFIGHTSKNYMIAQIIAASITIVFMYFASYRPTQENYGKKLKLSTELLINLLWIAGITLLISFGLNNVISMSPLVDMSEAYKKANEDFYASTLLIELVGSAILSPIMEELVFRGIVFGNLKKIMSPIAATIISALLFGIVHFNIVQFVYALLLGIVLAMFMQKTGHMYAAVAGHIVANAFAVLRTETGIFDWSLNNSPLAWLVSALSIMLGIFILFLYFKIYKNEKNSRRCHM